MTYTDSFLSTSLFLAILNALPSTPPHVLRGYRVGALGVVLEIE
jgi:hypothetical protein